MQPTDIRLFIPSKDFAFSQTFYQALGFSRAPVNDQLCIFSQGGCTFFLQNFYNQAFAENLMMQLIVKDINAALKQIENMGELVDKYEPIQQETWGKVIYLSGPAGELWHITQLTG
ncbi:lactoylglutathione lyase [Paraglaciecola agarilytica]|uniref:lactoylglutathione lyase n=1 Tax=Paraglaciecola chathamensis TaxID=368405 RepID=UPI001C08DDF0|nr:lactoylglutathione lyase [Paraglaciecola agarilytica]MBU3016881.1 lactoylglutathione lyase [Paraglaciecola agarilytica]